MTVVHGQKHVLNDVYSPRYRERLEASIRARGVKFVLGDVVENIPQEPGTFTTRNGVTLTADFVVSSRSYTYLI